MALDTIPPQLSIAVLGCVCCLVVLYLLRERLPARAGRKVFHLFAGTWYLYWLARRPLTHEMAVLGGVLPLLMGLSLQTIPGFHRFNSAIKSYDNDYDWAILEYTLLVGYTGYCVAGWRPWFFSTHELLVGAYLLIIGDGVAGLAPLFPQHLRRASLLNRRKSVFGSLLFFGAAAFAMSFDIINVGLIVSPMHACMYALLGAAVENSSLVGTTDNLFVFIAGVLGAHYSNEYLETTIGICFALFLAEITLYKGSFTLRGAQMGATITIVHILAGIYDFALPLVTFVIGGVLASRFRSRVSETRTAYQVLANSFVPLVGAVIILLQKWIRLPIDYTRLGLIAYAVYSEALTDTMSSEVGVTLHKGQVLSIGRLRLVPAGTDGGISLPGLLAGASGALVLGGLRYLTIGLSESRANAINENKEVLTIVVAGICGSMVDSLLGAWFQDMSHVFSNGAVNLLSTVLVAVVVHFIE